MQTVRPVLVFYWRNRTVRQTIETRPMLDLFWPPTQWHRLVYCAVRINPLKCELDARECHRNYLGFNLTIPFEHDVSWKNMVFPGWGFRSEDMMSSSSFRSNMRFLCWKHSLPLKRKPPSDQYVSVAIVNTRTSPISILGMVYCRVNFDIIARTTICKSSKIF